MQLTSHTTHCPNCGRDAERHYLTTVVLCGPNVPTAII